MGNTTILICLALFFWLVVIPGLIIFWGTRMAQLRERRRAAIERPGLDAARPSGGRAFHRDPAGFSERPPPPKVLLPMLASSLAGEARIIER